MHRRPQEIPVTVLGHPPRTGKMTVVDTSGALTISVRIEAKQEPDHLRPLRPLVRRVEKPNVEREVLSIIILALRMCLMAGGLTAKRDWGLPFSC